MPRDRDISPRDRSIRNIPVPASHHRATPTPVPRYASREEEEYDEEDDSFADKPAPRLKLPRRRSRLWVWILLIISLCAILGLLLSTVFTGATVTVSPREVSAQTGQVVIASPGGPSGTLLYQTLTGSQSASTSVAAGGTQHVSRPATGIVTIYNTYSTAAQPLVASTRIATSDGKIYRIKAAVTVPGATKKTDGTLSPGSVTASIYADKPGADYNQSDSVQMHVVGFKGDPRYDKFVVESQGTISGGFIGDEATVAPADLATAQNTLKLQLDQNIRAAATSQVPDGFLQVNGSLGLSYSDISQTPGPNNTVVLAQSVTATLAIIRGNDLASVLAKQADTTYNGEPVAFDDPSAVTLSLAKDASSTGPLSITVGGAPKIVWQFDSTALKQSLLGKKKSDFQSILTPFAGALMCDKEHPCSATIRPFWIATFPADPARVTVNVSH